MTPAIKKWNTRAPPQKKEDVPENPDERRRKNRDRKRHARAKAAAARPLPDSSSSDEAGCPSVIGGIPQVFSVFPVNPIARQTLAARTAELNPASRPRHIDSVVVEDQGNTEETPASSQHRISDSPPAYGNEGGFQETQSCDDVQIEGDSDINETSPGNPQGITDNVEGQGAPVQDRPTEGRANEEENGGEARGNPEETPEICQPLLANPNSTEAFALTIAKIKGTSHVSNAAINKVLEAAVENMDVLREFWENRGASRLYTGCLRPVLEPFIPKVFSGVLLEIKHPTGIEYKHIEGLSSIPKKYKQEKGKVRVIREESYVKLQDIKRHYMGVNAQWGMTVETARKHFENAALSIDGVQESHKGKKKFHVVTIRFGRDIFVYKIFNPLVGHPAAHPSLGELLG